MTLDPSLAICVDNYAVSQEHKEMHAAGPMLSAEEVKGALSDLWSKLLAMGKAVDWPTVYAKLIPIIAMLFQGKSVQDVIAVILSWFAPAPVPQVP